MDYTTIIISIIGGYLIGSIPFGYIITRLSGQGDIRDIGSGNIGATNVLRTGKKSLAILTLIFDAGKAAVAVLVASHLFGEAYGLFAGAFALLGHCYSVWLKFDGGKGVATFFGCLLASAWPVGLSAMGVWLAAAVLTRISALGALCAAGFAPLIAMRFGHFDVAAMAAGLAIVIFIRHIDNIKRMAQGKESKIGQKAGTADNPETHGDD